ncbi:gamma-glutamyl-gamma-aminobutyrate hydrolase PuuD [Elusimicrobium posterum]|uniref:gamma-glutamyl-gamma-aminobutyrate hydrolase family protein n=1 Tax=Elusimicrobium posterum TaxID=3116653 RepID=UPI003C71A343
MNNNLIKTTIFILASFSLAACSAKHITPQEKIIYLTEVIYTQEGATPDYEISDKEIKKLSKQGILPIFKISESDAQKLLPEYDAANAAPIGILFARGKKSYQMPADYVYSLLKAGADIYFISYDDMQRQTEKVKGIVLPGGNFPIPVQWFVKYTRKKVHPLDKRYNAYKFLVEYAAEKEMPLLGVCGGMQVMAGLLSGEKVKLYDDLTYVTTIDHRYIPKTETAHSIKIEEGSKLHGVLGATEMEVNSRHSVGVAHISLLGLESVKATAIAPDMVVEAVEFPGHKNFLGVQFHPEIASYNNDNSTMQKIFDSFVLDTQQTQSK